MGDFDVAKYPGLYLRNGVWYVRKKVPTDLRQPGKSDQVRVGLETSDRKEAVRRYPLKLAEIEAKFAHQRLELRSQRRREAAMDGGRIEKLPRADLDALIANWWISRQGEPAPLPDEDVGPGEFTKIVSDILLELEDLRALDGSSPDPAVEAADRLLVRAGMARSTKRVGNIETASLYPKVDRDSDAYQYLVSCVRSGLEVEGRLALDQLVGGRTAPEHPLFNPPPGTSPRTPSTGFDGRQLRDLIEQYEAERVVLFGRESTNRKYALLFRVLIELLGAELPVAALDRQKCVEVLAFLRRLPSNAAKKYPQLTLIQAADRAATEGVKGLAPNTVGAYMQNLTALLNWAERGGWPTKANTAGLVTSREPNVQRRGFKAVELRTIFTALEVFKAHQPTRYWVPALAAFTGARAGEVCQLRVADIVRESGVWCLNLTEFDGKGEREIGKRLKTRSSERYVPLHEGLISAGFIEFVKSIGEQERLFPDLKAGPNGGFSHDMSKWFGRFLNKIDLTDRSLVFHSFRHGFRDACRAAEIPEETALALGGWARINQAQRYGDRGMVAVLDRAIRKLDFGGFRLVYTDVSNPE
jgi:integrase